MEKGEITNNAEIAKQSKLIECHAGNSCPLLLCFLLSSVFQRCMGYSALATNSPVSIFPALFTCTKIR
jgi:hypothetical protein